MKKLILSQDQKRDLEQLKNSAGYKVLDLINEQIGYDLGQLLLKHKLTPENIEIITRNQLFMEARESFFKDIDKHLNKVYTPNIGE